MTRYLRSASLIALLCTSGAVLADAPVFGASPIVCSDPAGATVDTPCGLTAVPRGDGYEFVGYGFHFIFPPPPPGAPPVPMVAANDSMRDFINPIAQNLIVNIFGNTKVDVIGPPVLFFVNGTLDGTVVASFSQGVAGGRTAVTWDVSGLVPNVSAGKHTLDMHFGIFQLVPGQLSEVNVASLYQVTASVPEPTMLALWLAGIGAVGLLKRRQRPAG